LKTSVREFGAHDGFWPATSTAGAMLPSTGITQISKSPACRVKAIHLPSGDQSGSVGFGAPAVLSVLIGPPLAETLASRRRSAIFVAKQIHWPSGDQQGEESSRPVVRRFKFEPSALQTQTFGLPLLLKIIATFEPASVFAGLVKAEGIRRGADHVRQLTHSREAQLVLNVERVLESGSFTGARAVAYTDN